MQVFTSISGKLPVTFVSYRGAGTGTAQMGLKATTDPALIIDHILATNADTAVAKLTLYYYLAGTYYPIGACIIPIGAGMAGAVAFDCLKSCEPTDFGSLAIPANAGLAWALDANLTAGQLTVVALGQYI